MVALERANIKVDNYYASEIDKYAIQISKKNYSNIIQLGDINNWESWDLPKIDLLIGGSPCQGFSNSGKGLNFNDPRSKLFFVFVDILKDLKNKNSDLKFLLENVKMKKEWRDIISETVGVYPIQINSALVSAQSRKRLYWTNISNIMQPEDRSILLKDIIESGDVDREKSYCIDANYYKGGGLKNYLEKSRRQIVGLSSDNLHQSEKRLMVKTIPHGYMKENIVARYKYPSLAAQSPDTKYVVENVGKDCVQIGEADIKGFDIIKRVYSPNGKSPSLTAMQGGNREPKITEDDMTWRKLTPIECERLQTLPDNYTEGVSNTQRYKSLGNGWTVDVIAHIFSFLPEEWKVT
jgi:DNA (cytosine-5)-methyltransferase 3A